MTRTAIPNDPMRLTLCLFLLSLAACSHDFQPETKEGVQCVEQCETNATVRGRALVQDSPVYRQCINTCRQVERDAIQRDNIHNP